MHLVRYLLSIAIARIKFLACRVRAASKAQGDGAKRTRARDRAVRAFPAPEANAELQSNLDVCLMCCFFQLVV